MMQSYHCAFSYIDIFGYQSHPHCRSEVIKTVWQGFDKTGDEPESRTSGFVQALNLLIELFTDRYRNLEFRNDRAQPDECLKSRLSELAINEREEVTWHRRI